MTSGFRRLLGAVAIAVVAIASLAWVRIARDEHRFPHRVHEKLFPTCIGCHAGVVTGLQATTFPAPETCARCHNGIDAKAVRWAGPARTASNLKFDHVVHAKYTSDASDKLQCLRCHGQGDSLAARPWMVVRRAPPTECLSCHEHRASMHLASEARCETCHVPLAQATALSDSAISGFPKPPSHDDPNWISTHAPSSASALAQCATCHARESCARCHVNASTLSAITSLANDVRVARVVHGLAPRYPVPVSHHSSSFAQAHGALASSPAASCANCHAQASCQTCHLGTMGAKIIGKLPKPAAGSAAGVRLEGTDISTPETSPGSSPRAGGSMSAAARRDTYAAAARAQDTVVKRRAVAAAVRQSFQCHG